MINDFEIENEVKPVSLESLTEAILELDLSPSSMQARLSTLITNKEIDGHYALEIFRMYTDREIRNARLSGYQ